MCAHCKFWDRNSCFSGPKNMGPLPDDCKRAATLYEFKSKINIGGLINAHVEIAKLMLLGWGSLILTLERGK